MKLKTFTFLKHKTYLFSFIALMLGSILCSLPAYSQVDYYYGINKKGVRVNVGLGVNVLQSNWSSNSPGAAGLFGIDYDLNPYFSIGLQFTGGMMTGKDPATATKGGKFYFKSDEIIFVSGSIGFRVAAGQFIKKPGATRAGDILRRVYIGAGIGEVFVQAKLTPHNGPPNDAGISSLGSRNVQDNNLDPIARTFEGEDLTPKNGVSKVSGTSIIIPISFGTNIALRGFLGNDRVELNPNIQYTVSPSDYMDGYEPSGYTNGLSPTKKNEGGQAFVTTSLTLRFKF